MALHSKHRTGCDCLNHTPPTQDGPPGVCNGDCGNRNGHCTYAMLPECDYYTVDGERYAVPCMLLRKLCVTSRTGNPRWVSVWEEQDYQDATVFLSPNCLFPMPDWTDGWTPCEVCPEAAIFLVTYRNTENKRFANLCFTRRLDESCCAETVDCTYQLYDILHDPSVSGCLCLKLYPREAKLTGRLDDTTFTITLNDWDCGPVIDAIPDEPEAAHIRVTIRGMMLGQCPLVSPDGLFECCSVMGRYWPYNELSEARPDYFIKWTLEADDDCKATLTGNTRDGRTIVFEKENWNKNKRETFAIVSRDDGLEGFPPCICIAPYDSRYFPVFCPQGEDVAQCECCHDFNCGIMRFFISLCGETPVEIGLSRVMSTDDLLLGVQPRPWKCIAYWGTIDLGANSCLRPFLGVPELGFLIWCDGTRDGWHVDTYCYKDDNVGWEFQLDAIDSVECRCSGVYYTFSTGDLPCVCCCRLLQSQIMEVNAEVNLGLLCGCDIGPFTGTLNYAGPGAEGGRLFVGEIPGAICGRTIKLEFVMDFPCRQKMKAEVDMGDGRICRFELNLLECSCISMLYISDNLASGDLGAECDGLVAGGPCYMTVLLTGVVP